MRCHENATPSAPPRAAAESREDQCRMKAPSERSSRSDSSPLASSAGPAYTYLVPIDVDHPQATRGNDEQATDEAMMPPCHTGEETYCKKDDVLLVVQKEGIDRFHWRVHTFPAYRRQERGPDRGMGLARASNSTCGGGSRCLFNCFSQITFRLISPSGWAFRCPNERSVVISS